MATWRGSMLDALAATLGRPAWWSMALAAFLVRGGVFLVLLPIISLPSPAALETALSPAISALVFGGLSGAALAAIGVAGVLALALLFAAGLAGAWLDRELLREAALDDDLDLRWAPAHGSLPDALALRLAAHVPTLAAVAYATFRLITAGYDELLSPGDVAEPLFLRIAGRAPDAVGAVLATWILGEAVAGLAARRAAAGLRLSAALSTSVRQLVSRRGLATVAATTLAVVGAIAPFLLAAGRAWAHVRDVLLVGGEAGFVAAALVVLVASWILGLAILGAALAWRSAAWTAMVVPTTEPSGGGSVVAATPTEA